MCVHPIITTILFIAYTLPSLLYSHNQVFAVVFPFMALLVIKIVCTHKIIALPHCDPAPLRRTVYTKTGWDWYDVSCIDSAVYSNETTVWRFCLPVFPGGWPVRPSYQRPHQPILPRLEREDNQRNLLPHPPRGSMFIISPNPVPDSSVYYFWHKFIEYNDPSQKICSVHYSKPTTLVKAHRWICTVNQLCHGFLINFSFSLFNSCGN